VLLFHTQETRIPTHGLKAHKKVLSEHEFSRGQD